MLGWASTPYGSPALFAVSFTESSFFPIPPDLLQIALTLGRPARAFFYAGLSTAASVLGGVFGWWIGMLFWGAASAFFFNHVPGLTPERFEEVRTAFGSHAFLAILGAAFTPIPYKVFTLAAGACAVDPATLVFASVLGRGGRFYGIAAALRYGGPRVVPMLKRHLAWVTVALFAVIALVVLVLGSL